MPELTILMPCLNEAKTIVRCIEEARAVILEHNLDAEILVADNGSNDSSQQLAQAAGARVCHVEARGYGSALLGGINESLGTYIVMGDADQSYDFREVPSLLAKLRQGNDLVMGCRFPSGGGRILPGAMPWKHRYIGNPVLSFLGRRLFKVKIHDFHCGLRGFRTDSIRKLGLSCSGMEFATEMVAKAAIANLRVDEIPITLRPDGRGRPPHLRSWRDGWRHLRFMLLLSPSWLFLFPGFFLFFFSFLIFFPLILTPISIGSVEFDTNTLLICSLGIIVGVQSIGFGLFANTYAAKIKLLPEKPLVKKATDLLTFENGLIIGASFGFFGLILLFSETLVWIRTGFGPLFYRHTLRTVIPGMTFIVLGLQIILTSFILSVLHLPTEAQR